MISNAEAIYRKLQEVYPDGMVDITTLSRNDNATRSLVVSGSLGFNYDNVINCHPDCSRNEKSPDALFCVNDTLYFVEFKDGAAKKDDLRLKIHEGIATLYFFCQMHLPSLTRNEFFSLDIRYALLQRDPELFNPQGKAVSFIGALETTSKKYHLKNLEGYLVKKVRLAFHHKSIGNVMSIVTRGSSGGNITLNANQEVVLS